MAAMTKPLVVASVLGLIGLIAICGSIRARRKRGLISGSTGALANVTLFSPRLRLVGRPDRIVKRGKTLIPEEWKSGRRLEPWHEYQLGAYFLLIEEKYRVRPPHGFVVLGDGKRHRVENTEELRQAVISVARRIRDARREPARELPGVLR
jgi:CRISPR-associated exonuclease Cas4